MELEVVLTQQERKGMLGFRKKPETTSTSAYHFEGSGRINLGKLGSYSLIEEKPSGIVAVSMERKDKRKRSNIRLYGSGNVRLEPEEEHYLGEHSPLWVSNLKAGMVAEIKMKKDDEPFAEAPVGAKIIPPTPSLSSSIALEIPKE